MYTIQSHILFARYDCSGASIIVDRTDTIRLTDRQNHSTSLRFEQIIFRQINHLLREKYAIDTDD